MQNLHGNDFICWSYKKHYVQKKKIPQLSLKISAVPSRNQESSSEMARFVKTQHGNSLQTISNFTTASEVSSRHHSKVELFLTYFPFSLFSKMKSPFLCGSKQVFCILACLIFLHKPSTCGEDHKIDIWLTLLCNNLCTCSSNLNYLH